MNKTLFYMLLMTMAVSCGPTGERHHETAAPVAEKHHHELIMHGDTRIDPYYWLNDRDNPAVIAYIEEENRYLDAMMKHTMDMQGALFEEMKARIRQDDQSAPFFRNGYFYYTRFEEGTEYPIYCRRPGSMDAPEEVMLDVNQMAEPHPYYRVGRYDISPDNRWMAFTADTVGRRQYTVLVKDLATGEVMPTGISHAGGDVVWAADNEHLFFSRIDPATLRYYQIQRFNPFLGQEPVTVYEEADETYYYIGVSRSKDMRYLVITANATLSNEIHILEADEPLGDFRVFQPRQPNLRYRIWSYNGKFYVLTNDGAENFRLMETSGWQTGREHWREVIAHRDDVLLENIELFDDYLVLQERQRGLQQMRIINLVSGSSHYLPFEEEAYTASIGINAEMSTSLLRFNYTSLTTPMSSYDYHMDSGEMRLVKQQEVLGDFRPENYETRRYYVTARDGAEVPLTVVYRKGMERNGQNPFLLYAYGSYGASANPRFNINALSLLDRGFAYGIAHVRGGQVMGRR